MNGKLLGATLVAIAALVGTPIIAEAVTDLNAVRVQMDKDGNFKGIVFRTLGVVPTDGSIFGGYAIPTSGDFIAITSHTGTLDSVSQVDANDPIWHSHLVKASKNISCESVAIDALSLEEPSYMVKIRGANILVKAIANGTSTYTDAISEDKLEFTVGNPIELKSDTPRGPSGLVESISFDLNEAPNGTICIGELSDLKADSD